MAKLSTLRSANATTYSAKQSAKTQLATFRKVAAGLQNDPTRLREVAVKAGISTPTGKLKKAYGGK